MLRARFAPIVTAMLALCESAAFAAAGTPATWNDFVSVDPLNGQYDEDLVQQLADKIIFFFDEVTPRINRYDLNTKELVEHRCDSVQTSMLDAPTWREQDKDILINTIQLDSDSTAEKNKMIIWWDLSKNTCFNATPVTDKKTQVINSVEFTADRHYLYYTLLSRSQDSYRFDKVEYYGTDLTTGQTTRLYEAAGPFSSWYTPTFPISSAMIEGKRMLFVGIPTDDNERILKVDAVSGQAELIKQITTEGTPEQVTYSEKAQRLFFSSTRGTYSVAKDGTTTTIATSKDVMFSPDKSRFCRQGVKLSEIVEASSLQVLMQTNDEDDCETISTNYIGEPDFSSFAYWRTDSYPYSRALFFCNLNEKNCKQMAVDDNEGNKVVDHYGIRIKQKVILVMDFETKDQHLYAVIRNLNNDVIARLDYDTQRDEVFRLDRIGSRIFLNHDGILKMLTVPTP